MKIENQVFHYFLTSSKYITIMFFCYRYRCLIVTVVIPKGCCYVKLGNQVENPEISKKFSPDFQIWVFDFALQSKSKTRNNISEISEFSICHFLIFQKKVFQYSKVGNSVLYICVIHCFQTLLKCFFFQQKYIIFKILLCRKNVYFLWNISILKRLSFFKNFLKSHLRDWERNMHK